MDILIASVTGGVTHMYDGDFGCGTPILADDLLVKTGTWRNVTCRRCLNLEGAPKD